MFMQELKSLNTDDTDRFNAEYDTVAYPVIFYFDRFSNYDIGYVKWHWHYSPQFVTATDTPVELIVDKTRVILSPGESAFINSNRLHVIKSADPKPDDVSISILFLPELIAEAGSRIYEKYVMPLISSQDISFIHFSAGTDWHDQANACIIDAIRAQTAHEDGYELEVRDAVSHVWRLIYRHIDSLMTDPLPDAEMNTQIRIKKMVSYIYDKYADDISLSDIAAAASVSKSECNRCFKKYFGITPVHFLIEHRISNAAQMLTDSADSIRDISTACGFSDASYFNRMFRKFRGMTPTDYRSQCELLGN